MTCRTLAAGLPRRSLELAARPVRRAAGRAFDYAGNRGYASDLRRKQLRIDRLRLATPGC